MIAHSCTFWSLKCFINMEILFRSEGVSFFESKLTKPTIKHVVTLVDSLLIGFIYSFGKDHL